MSEGNGYQHGVPCWVDTWQPDADAAVDFYKAIFGWEAEDTMPEGVSGKHYMCRLRGQDVAAVASTPEDPPPTAWTTYIWVDDAEATVAKVKEAGGSVLKEPFDSLDVGRIAIVTDSSGAALGVWQPGEHRGAQLVNEPSAWAMSRLSTDDTEAAKRFYGTVFGWDHETFGARGAEMTLWKVPGYVGGRPEQPVARDVVATMGPAGENGDAPPHWGVDFWIADVDTAAATAADRGGRILAGPYDIPEVGMRRAELIDPQGARLALTQPPGSRSAS
jgi:predicted enzyme related to lactoylglutathione lyase